MVWHQAADCLSVGILWIYILCKAIFFLFLVLWSKRRPTFVKRCSWAKPLTLSPLCFVTWQVLMHTDGNPGSFLCQRLPVLTSMTQLDGTATAYVCQDFSCSLPITEPQELRRLLLDRTAVLEADWDLTDCVLQLSAFFYPQWIPKL